MSKKLLTICVFGLASLVGCNQSGSGEQASDVFSSQSASNGSVSEKQAIVKFNLTDAPNKELKSVVVDIDHMEVVVAGKGKQGRLILAKGLGPVDLLKLQNGVTLPLQDIVAPEGIRIQQIRLILKSEGHYAVKTNDEVCELKTPSAQKTGVKIILTNKVEFEAGHEYNILVDFDAHKSVVVQGNGGCLLKPVLKLKSAYKKPIETETDEEANDNYANPGCENGSCDPGTGSDTDVDNSTDTGSDTGVDTGSDNTGGEELVVTPEENDSTTDDGWDYTPVVDGQDVPVVTESELESLL